MTAVHCGLLQNFYQPFIVIMRQTIDRNNDRFFYSPEKGATSNFATPVGKGNKDGLLLKFNLAEFKKYYYTLPK